MFYYSYFKWGLVTNLQKCKFKQFRFINHAYQYYLGIEMLNVSRFETVLNVLTDVNLTLKVMYAYVSRKV